MPPPCGRRRPTGKHHDDPSCQRRLFHRSRVMPKNAISYAWKFLLGAGLFAYVASLVRWEVVLDKFRDIAAVVVVVAMLLVLMQAVLLGFRWRAIGRIDGIELPVRQHIVAVLISFFFAQGLPASLGGDAFRIWWYARRGVEAGRGLKVIAFDRIIGLVSMALVCILSIAVLILRQTGTPPVAGFLLVIVLVIAGFVLLALPMRVGLSDALVARAERLPNALAKMLRWLVEMRQFFRLGSPRQLGGILLLGVLVHLLAILLGYILARGLGAEVGFWACLAAIAPALFLTYLPISIAGWGVRELALVLTFGMVGVDRETALLVSLGIGTIVLLVSLIGGLLWGVSGMRQLYFAQTAQKSGSRAP